MWLLNYYVIVLLLPLDWLIGKYLKLRIKAICKHRIKVADDSISNFMFVLGITIENAHILNASNTNAKGSVCFSSILLIKIKLERRLGGRTMEMREKKMVK